MSYRSGNYMQWRAGSAGSSSYSPGSSTSSVGSSTTSGIGSVGSKYSSLSSASSIGSNKDISTAKDSSYSSSLSGSGAVSARLSRFSSLSSRGDSAASSTPASSTYGSSNSSLSSTSSNKTSYGSTISAPKEKSGLGSYSSSLGSNNNNSNNGPSSKFGSSATSMDSNSSSVSSSYRPSSAYLRTSGALSSSRESLTSKQKSTAEDLPTVAKKSMSTSIGANSSPSTANSVGSSLLSAGNTLSSVTGAGTGSSTATANQSSSGNPSTSLSTSSNTNAGKNNESSPGSNLGAYRLYNTRILNTPELKPISNTSSTTSSISSSLRTSRFGLRSGNTYGNHYTSSLSSPSTYEPKKEKPETIMKRRSGEINEVVTWMSRGTCTDPSSSSIAKKSDANKMEADKDVSIDETPSFTPRKYEPERVMKHKEIQTDKEKEKLLSCIPRPSPSLNYYSPFGSAMSRFSNQNSSTTSKTSTVSSINKNNETTTTTPNDSSFKSTALNDSVASDSNSSSSSSNPKIKAINKNIKTLGTLSTIANDQSRPPLKTGASTVSNTATTSSESSTSDNDSSETSKTSENSSATSSPKSAPKVADKSNKAVVAPTSPGASGIVVTLANKEFRKSALNVELETKEAETDYTKKQEELRKQKVALHNTIPAPSGVSTTNTTSALSSNSNNSKNINNNDNNTPAASGLTTKRDPPRRPPTDPNKSSASIQPSRSINRIAAVGSSGLLKTPSTSSSNLATGLVKMKSSKNVAQLRKSSTSSTESESGSSSSCSSANSNSNPPSNSPNKAATTTSTTTVTSPTANKKKLYSNHNNSTSSSNLLEYKGQGRRGSATSTTTSCSSAASSRSNSCERNKIVNNNNNNSSSNNNNSSTNKHEDNNLSKPVLQPATSEVAPSAPTTNKAKQIKDIGSKSKKAEKEDADETSEVLVIKIKSCSPKETSPPSSSSSDSNKSNTQKQEPEGDSAQAKQTSFIMRTLGERPWVRKCQSGDLPWWMASNPDVPSILGRNPSRTLVRNPTAKQSIIQEEGNVTPVPAVPVESTSSSDSDSDEELHHAIISRPLEERTSPDGGEIPPAAPDSANNSQSSTLLAKNNSNLKLFIGTMTNIDDILGAISPGIMPESPSPAPTPIQQQLEQVVSNFEKGRRDAEGDSDDDDSSSSDSDDEVVEGDIMDHLHNDDSSGDDDDDGSSTGTSSSFEEVDPASVKSLAAPEKTLPILTSCSGTLLSEQLQASKGSTLASATSAELIPQPQRDKLDDATLQLYKDGDYGTYLDLEASISEQQEEFDGFLNNRKNSIVLRAQLPVRVHAIIEKMLNSDGRELRRALFSLKQIFQDDKDLVYNFVENGGLSCLIKVGSEADQNYQNYILRAIGQVMLYVDGMYGVMRHNETIQWLYNLVASKFRLVQKTALKLLLVFVDYVESNCLLLVQAVTAVDTGKGAPLWSNVMALLREHDSNSGDTELLVYAMTLVNKVLNGIPDIDTYYDQVDALEENGMASLIQQYMGKQCADLDLLQQFQIYEVVLKHEDGEEDNIMMQLDEGMRQKLLNRKGCVEIDGGNKERRKSRRHSANGPTPPTTPIGNGSSTPTFPHPVIRRLSSTEENRKDDESLSSASSSHSSSPAPNGSPLILNGYTKDKCNMDVGVTPALRKRRERAERQKSLLLEQKLVNGNHSSGEMNGHSGDEPGSPLKTPESPISLIPLGRSMSSKKDILAFASTNGTTATEQLNNLKNSSSNSNINNNNNNNNATVARPWMLPIYTKNGASASSASISNGCNGEKENGEIMAESQKRENTVKDLTQKLANQSLLTSPVDENKSFNRTGDLSGVVLKAKEGLAKSKSRADIKPPQSEGLSNGTGNNKGLPLESKKSDNELHWDFLVSNLQRPLEICDLDFTDLKSTDDEDLVAASQSLINGHGLPPPMPNVNGYPPPPPPNAGKFGGTPPPPLNGLNGLPNCRSPPAPPLFNKQQLQQNSESSPHKESSSSSKKTKKTVKLFWKEVRDDPVVSVKIEKVGCIWNELQPISLDTQRLEHLFESRAKDVINKKQADANKNKEIVVLDPKRSNAINIGMTKLPPPRTIKAAIMKMDATIINREGIEKLLSMLPTDEERGKIQEAQFANPETPLGSAEQFLLTLSSISELPARLKLWAFKLDYENLEKEVAEPLMDLKQGIEALEKNKTFRHILSTLLCIGNFLNGADARGFQIDYLAKVPEVKDTVHKHSLLHHLCQTVNENYPESTDLYSEIGAVTRTSRVDFDEVATNLVKMENDCKGSWDHLRVIAKHDGPTNMKLKMSEFLADCAERIIVLGIVHRRVMNRFYKFLLWLGVSHHQLTTTKPHVLFKIISEFALEYRTTRERVIQQLQKKANHRERNKTRGKMITEQIMYKTKEDKADAELRQVLNTTTISDNGDGEVVTRVGLSWTGLRKPKPQISTNIISAKNSVSLNHNLHNNKCATLNGNGTLTDGDDEILESLVKTATRTADTRAAPRERKRNNARYSDRKSLRRTLRHGLSDEERKMLAAFMANGHTFAA